MSAPALAPLGLRVGDVVRFRKVTGGRWVVGTVTGRERDGSVALRDGQGRSRSIRADRLEVRATGPRGASIWEPVTEHAGRAEQLRLL